MQMTETNEKLMVVNENGEVVTTITSGDRIVRGESVEYLGDTVEWGKNMPFVKMFTEFLPEVALKLSGGAAIVALALSQHIAYGSNLICNRSSNNPINNDEIGVITGYNKRQIMRIMDELVAAKVFARTKVGHSYQYYANPYIFSKGSRINKTLEAMFKNYPHEQNKGDKNVT